MELQCQKGLVLCLDSHRATHSHALEYMHTWRCVSTWLTWHQQYTFHVITLITWSCIRRPSRSVLPQVSTKTDKLRHAASGRRCMSCARSMLRWLSCALAADFLKIWSFSPSQPALCPRLNHHKLYERVRQHHPQIPGGLSPQHLLANGQYGAACCIS